jgi:hypothetical protein
MLNSIKWHTNRYFRHYTNDDLFLYSIYPILSIAQKNTYAKCKLLFYSIYYMKRIHLKIKYLIFFVVYN